MSEESQANRTGKTSAQPKDALVGGSRAEPFKSVRATAPKLAQACSEVFKTVPQRSEMSSNGRNEKTNPPPHSRDKILSPRQLFAARALAGGRTSAQVAKSLSTSQQTVNRWRRNPQFAGEVQLLHEVILREAVRKSAPPSSGAAKAPPPPIPRVLPRSQKAEATDEEMAELDRQYEAEMIRKHGKGALARVRIVNGKLTVEDL